MSSIRFEQAFILFGFAIFEIYDRTILGFLNMRKSKITSNAVTLENIRRMRPLV